MVGRKSLFRSRHSSRFRWGSVSSEASNSGANNTHFLDLPSRASSGVNWSPRAAKKPYSRCVCRLKSRYEIEFNLLNRYLIVPATPQFIFDHDGKRVPHKDTAKSSQPRTSWPHNASTTTKEIEDENAQQDVHHCRACGVRSGAGVCAIDGSDQAGGLLRPNPDRRATRDRPGTAR